MPQEGIPNRPRLLTKLRWLLVVGQGGLALYSALWFIQNPSDPQAVIALLSGFNGLLVVVIA